VNLTAIALEDIDPLIPASFSRVIEVQSDGLLSGEVLPGRYRARAVPAQGSGLAQLQDTLDVQCKRPNQPGPCETLAPGAPIPTQAGHALLLPPAAQIDGSLTSPLGHSLLAGATVQMLPSSTRRKRCTDQTNPDAGVDGGTDCESAFPELNRQLGLEAFVPRVASATADSRSRFTVRDADCGACSAGRGAVFDFVVRPEGISAMPWLVRTGISISESTDLGSVEVPLPVVRSGVVQVPQANPLLVGGALIRAYVYVDDTGQYVADPDSLTSCTSPLLTAEERCLRSVVQVAETRAQEDGSYRLLIPSRLE
jgi:hypothetical protein